MTTAIIIQAIVCGGYIAALIVGFAAIIVMILDFLTPKFTEEKSKKMQQTSPDIFTTIHKNLY